MKRKTLAGIAAIGMVLALVLSACENPAGGGGGGGGIGGGGKATLTLSLGSGSNASLQSAARAAGQVITQYDGVNPPSQHQLDNMILVIDLTHESGHTESLITKKGASSAELVVFSGKWNIKVLVYLDSVDDANLYAEGHQQVTALANKTNPVTVPMGPPSSTSGPPVIIRQPQSAAYNLNATPAPLTVTASGGGLSYQWHSSGGAVISGATGSSFTPNTAAIGTYYYYVVVTASNGLSVTSGVATVDVMNLTDYQNMVDFGSGTAVTTMSFDGTAATNALETYLTSILLSPGNYAITVDGNQHQIQGGTINTITLGIGVKVSLRGSGTITKIAGSGSRVWSVNSFGKLILRGVTLHGGGTDYAVVDINGGELVMESGTITGSANTSGDGGGVYLMNGGSFTMKNGSISGNVTGSKGGGVYVGNPGSTFTMTGGTITGNTAGSNGGGVYIEGGILGLVLSGTFNLNPPAAAGSISGNTPNQVYNDGGTFKVNGSNGSNY